MAVCICKTGHGKRVMGNCGVCTRACLRGATYENTDPDTLEGRELVVVPRKVYDGDTIWVVALSDKGCCGVPKKQRLHIRLSGYDSPELKPKTAKTSPAYKQEVDAALHARDFLESLLRNKVIKARFSKRDKYGRHLAELFVAGQSINVLMVATGHGVPYAGGTKAVYGSPQECRCGAAKHA